MHFLVFHERFIWRVAQKYLKKNDYLRLFFMPDLQELCKKVAVRSIQRGNVFKPRKPATDERYG